MSDSSIGESSFSSVHDDYDDWEGVNAICQLIDTIMHVEREYDFFENKNVLEVSRILLVIEIRF